MIIDERDNRKELALDAAKRMLVAARTAPKGKGIDMIECAIATDDDVVRISEEMHRISEETGFKFFLRDAQNIQQGECVVLIGTRDHAQGLNCGHCGFPRCIDRTPGVPCEINSVDVGIAIGSACSIAMDARVDTRVMFSTGLAAQRLKILGDDVKQVYAIAVSISSKNPFFDRAQQR